MSYLIADPELIETGAQDLAGIRATLGEATATAAPATTGVAAAAADEVSTAIASVFGKYGKEFQVATAQAGAFHDEFVNVLKGGAAAYLSTEIANAERNLLDVVNAPAQAAQAVSRSIASAPLLLGSTSSGAPIFADTVANLRTLANVWLANPAPVLRQSISNQLGYLQQVGTGVHDFIQGLPASAPAQIRHFVEKILNIEPVALLQNWWNNQLSYLNTITTSVGPAIHDFNTGLHALPAAFQAAFQDLVAGDVSGAVSEIAKAFANLFVTGVDVSNVGTTFFVTPTGALGDLLPLLTLPGAMTQNFADLFPTTSIQHQFLQNTTNAFNTALDTTISATLVTRLIPPSASLTAFFGMPWALTIDGLGSVVTTVQAVGTSYTAFNTAVQAADWQAAVGALIDAPANITNGFLNGQAVVPISLNLGGIAVTINIPFNGILAPTSPYNAVVSLGSVKLTIPVGGTPISGLAQALVNWVPEEIAEAIGKTPLTT